MKSISLFTIRYFLLLPGLLFFFFLSCEQPATSFPEESEAVIVKKSNPDIPVLNEAVIRVMTWNIRFGIGRGPWFGDACGYKVAYTEAEVKAKLDEIISEINRDKPDILLIQEVDLPSTRSGYVDQVKYILNRTYFNYVAFAPQWKAQFVPSDGLGRLEEMNAIYSRWPLSDAIRTQLDLRSNQMAIEKYFYERCCMVEAKVSIEGYEPFYAVCTHTSAFSTDNTKHQHLIEFKQKLDDLKSKEGYVVVGGGDLNEIPPGSDTTDYCIQNACEGYVYHKEGKEPFHKEGMNYTPEQDWLTPLYSSYNPVIPLTTYQQDQYHNFTHSSRPTHFWDRTLDYMFSNATWITSSGKVHQDCAGLSDHTPVSGLLSIKKTNNH